MDAFWIILQNTPLNKITVKDITQEAYINRSTFYQYFKDMPNLIQACEDELLESFIHNIPDEDILMEAFYSNNHSLISFSINSISRFDNNLILLLDDHGDPTFINRIQPIAYQRYQKVFKKNDSSIINEYYFHIVFTTIFQTYMFWNKRKDITREELISIILSIFHEGIPSNEKEQ